MVLVRTVLALLLAGCIKSGPPVQAPSSVDVASAVTMGTVDAVHSQAVPAELERVLRDVLGARRLNLNPQSAPDDFSARQSTAHRLRWLAANNSGAPIVLLVELNVRRFDNLGGRFRWVVDVQLSLALQADLAAAQTTRFSVPVHLGHAHNDATDAVAASLPTVRRRLSAAVDSHLAGAAAP